MQVLATEAPAVEEPAVVEYLPARRQRAGKYSTTMGASVASTCTDCGAGQVCVLDTQGVKGGCVW